MEQSQFAKENSNNITIQTINRSINVKYTTSENQFSHFAKFIRPKATLKHLIWAVKTDS